jgi:hypothetical protein
VEGEAQGTPEEARKSDGAERSPSTIPVTDSPDEKRISREGLLEREAYGDEIEDR